MHVQGFSSMDDLFDYLREQERAANEAATPEQHNIGPGSYFKYPYVRGLMIYGYVLTKEEFLQDEVEAGATPDELDFVEEHWDSSFARGYRYSRCYSKLCPEGEYGHVHISVMTQITEEEFEAAKSTS